MYKILSSTVTAVALAAGTLGTAQAQADYPNKPIRLVVPYAAGGGTDVQARKVASYLADALKQSVVVDNKPGAGTSIAAVDVAKAPADGYTLLWGDNATFAVNPHLYKNLPYDPIKSFAPITITVKGGVVLSVNPSIPVNNVSELIAYAKANPGKFSYGTPGNGTPHHLIMEAFKKAAGGLDFVHVPYKGEGPAITDLAGGTLQVMFSGAKVALSMSQAGRTRALAFSGPERNKAAPTIPTFAEAGFPGFVNEYWHGVVAPAGTPQPIINKLNAAFKQVMSNPELGAWLTANTGTRAIGSTPKEMTELMIEDGKRTGELVKSLNIQLN
jgi:tripartite-type tricarboxylate transporter receptor subunit TctC